MGVYFRLYAIPKNPDFRPSADALARLVEQLERGGWIPRGDKPWDGSKWAFDDRPYAAHPLFVTVPDFVRDQLDSLYFSIELRSRSSVSDVPEPTDAPSDTLASRGRYRFALIIDCNKCHWDEGRPTRLRPELAALVSSALGTELDQLGEFD